MRARGFITDFGTVADELAVAAAPATAGIVVDVAHTLLVLSLLMLQLPLLVNHETSVDMDRRDLVCTGRPCGSDIVSYRSGI